jgi:hypothetical protein
MMNNDFRKLLETPARQNDASPIGKPKAAPVSALGAKKTSLFGMTPRPGKAPTQDEFAKQMRERHASLQPPKKKFRSSAPKGSKFADGYIDRAKARQEAQDEEDDKAERIKALEEQVRLGQLPYETFEALRDKIAGGDVSTTHLVKGLDFKLLERVRRGEDVLNTSAGKPLEDEEAEPVDVDEELEKLQAQAIETAKREKTEKKGTMAPPPTTGVKRTRDEIMAELKAQRKAAAEAKAAAAPTFDGRWKKIGEQQKPKIEIDHKGREVITTVDKDGNVKKKVRKVEPITASDAQAAAKMPTSSNVVLGADFAVPSAKAEAQVDDDDDEDIFENAGTEYNPLGDIEDDDDDSDDDEEANAATKSTPRVNPPAHDSQSSGTGQTAPVMPAKPRNYFGNASVDTDEVKDRFKGIENVLKKAAQLGAAASSEGGEENETREEHEARLAKRAKMLAQEDRDLEDMDMGFGSSRFEDEQEGGEEKKMRLSEWKGGASTGDDGCEEDEKGGGKKKRKPKKRKGDVNNAADIFRVIEGRKAAQK